MAHTTRKQVFQLAATLAAVVDVTHTGNITTVMVDAPDGYRWQPDDVSAFRHETRGGFSEADWRDMLERMRASVLERE